MPYDTPDSSGRCFFMELPEEVMQLVFEQLDLQSLTRCYRVSPSGEIPTDMALHCANPS